jgi:acyl dehydratase
MPAAIPRVPLRGAALPVLSKGRLTSSHIARWCAAQENWAKIHYDESYARDVARLSGTLINGALKQHLLAQFLTEAFDGQGWVWRVDYQFTGMDLVGHALEVHGTVADVHKRSELVFVVVALEIRNLDTGKSTTSGSGVVILNPQGQALVDATHVSLPEDLRVATAVESPQGSVADAIRAAVGTVLDDVMSDYPLDLSRLRLFADAVMGLRPIHYDPDVAAATPYGVVVAPALFPLHGLDFRPNTFPLSDDPRASGREGVAELPRDLAARFGLTPTGSLNGGSRIEVHSLLRVGERIAAQSKLVGVKHTTGRKGGAMLIFETLNDFREAGGRPLLTERHSSIYRLHDSPSR